MASDREIIAKYADTPNRCSGCLRQTLGRGITFCNLRKEVEFESSFDCCGLLKGEDRVHEQIRRDVGHVSLAPWCLGQSILCQPTLARALLLAAPKSCWRSGSTSLVFLPSKSPLPTVEISPSRHIPPVAAWHLRSEAKLHGPVSCPSRATPADPGVKRLGLSVERDRQAYISSNLPGR